MIKRILFLFTVLFSSGNIFAQGGSYIIQRGDVLDVVVMEHPEFSLGGITVLPDGYIQYPGLGSLKVAGLSSEILTDSLRKSLEKYVVNPMVSIYIRKIQNQQLNIYGYVNKPGQYQLYDSLDLYSAIGVAGGLKSFRKHTTATIYRANRTMEIIKLEEFFDQSKKEQKIPMVYAGDTLYIVEPRQTNWAFLSFVTSALSLTLSIVTFARYY
jgi:polysaccharide export outer membrane protein